MCRVPWFYSIGATCECFKDGVVKGKYSNRVKNVEECKDQQRYLAKVRARRAIFCVLEG